MRMIRLPDRQHKTADGEFRGRTKQFWVQVSSLLVSRFHFFGRNPVGVGVGVVPNAGHLPGNLHPRPVGLDSEAVVANFLRHDRLGELPNHSQLVAEVPVQRLEVVRQNHHGPPAFVGPDIAVIDVHHVRRFDKRMGEVFVRRVERMVDLEHPSALGQGPGDVHVAVQVCRIVVATSAKVLRHNAAARRAIGGEIPAVGSG